MTSVTWNECRLSPPIYIHTKMSLSPLVIDSVINPVLDTVPRLLANLV